jgi:hypothetical protein
MPAYASLVLMVCVGALGWLAGSNYSSMNQVSVKQVIKQVDTVYLATRPDTVIREKIIYLKPEAPAPPSLQVSSKTLPNSQPIKGVNMKDKEELETLLVSGSL